MILLIIMCTCKLTSNNTDFIYVIIKKAYRKTGCQIQYILFCFCISANFLMIFNMI